MGIGTLVFSGEPNDGSGKLVFGEQGSAVIPDAVFSVDAQLPGLDGITLRTGVLMSVDAELPGLDVDVTFKWDANVSRSTLVDLQAHWQQATPVAVDLQAHWQETTPVAVDLQAHWQEAAPARSNVDMRWQDTVRLRGCVESHWQDAAKLRGLVDVHWQEAIRARSTVHSHWQDAAKLRSLVDVRWQDTLRLRGIVHSHWQDAKPARSALEASWGQAASVRLELLSHWQEAMRPLSGVSLRPPVVPESNPPCYDPASVGRLIFTDFDLGDGRLVFVCQRPGEVLPPARIVIPPSRTYVVINSVEIRRADDLNGDPLPSESFSMSLDHQSWSWKFSAAFHISAREALTLSSSGDPVELEVRINGQPFRLLAESANPKRQFGEHVVAVSGRGRAGHLDDKAAIQTFGNALDVSAHQLMLECLTINGTGFGWTVDWGITDWIVPGGVWMHRGTWISAIADIAGAAGAYLQPHDTAEVMRVLPLWPQPWWRFDQLTPDIELPEGYSEIDDTTISWQPMYERIYVSGETGGGLFDLSRAGSGGEPLLKPMVTHPLITSLDVARQLAIAELSETGQALNHKLILPINAAKGGVIKPGTILRYVDDSSAWRTGIVRSTSVAMQFPELTQSLEVQSHA